MIVAERQHMADLLASMSQEQLVRPSLCDAWTVHEVGAHLVSYLRFGQLKIYLCMLAYAGNFAPGNERLARMYARRSTADLAGCLRRYATAKTTVPRSGYDPVLADIVLHDLDVRIPLGIDRVIPRIALPRLDGDGVSVLSERVNQASRIPVAQRLTKMATTVLRPSQRRARHLGPPPLTSSSRDG